MKYGPGDNKGEFEMLTVFLRYCNAGATFVAFSTLSKIIAKLSSAGGDCFAFSGAILLPMTFDDELR